MKKYLLFYFLIVSPAWSMMDDDWKETQIIISQYRGYILDSIDSSVGHVGKCSYEDWIDKKQEWSIQRVDATYYRIVSAHTGKALDSWGIDTPQVGQFIIHDLNHPDYDKQLWKIKREKKQPYSDKYYYMIISKHTGQALDSWGEDSKCVGKYTSHSSDHLDYDKQLWELFPAGDYFCNQSRDSQSSQYSDPYYRNQWEEYFKSKK